MKDQLQWRSGGNLGLEKCKTEEELSEKLDEFLRRVSEELGDVTYELHGQTYCIGLTLNVLQMDGEFEYEDEDEILN